MVNGSDTAKWRSYEQAVAEFIKSLGTDAEVIHDAKVRDRETGTLRQIDVWIVAKFGGHFPFKIHVSCKDWDKRLSIEDVDHFRSELQSSGAQKGVIYSRNGFSDNAIRKAKALDISCCRLFEDQPAELPEKLAFHFYCFRPRIHLDFVEPADSYLAGTTWNDVFALPTNIEDGPETVLDYLAKCYQDHDIREQVKQTRTLFPTTWKECFRISFSDETKKPFWIRIGGSWQYFQGDVEACLANGSYNITDENYVGKVTGPVIDTRSQHPGPGWTEIKTPPDSIPANAYGMAFVANPKEWLKDAFGDKPIPIADELKE